MIDKRYTLKEKTEAAKDLVQTFHPERILYMVFAGLSFILLLGLGTYLFMKHELAWQAYLSLFLPTGGVTFCASQILTMFSKCLQFLKDELK